MNLLINRTKNNKGLIFKNNPLTFTAGNAFPLPKSEVTSRVPTGKPTVEEAFPVLEANLGANQETNLGSKGNSEKIRARIPSKNHAIEHHGVGHHIIGAVAYYIKGTF